MPRSPAAPAGSGHASMAAGWSAALGSGARGSSMTQFEFISPRPVSRTITFSEVARISDGLRRGWLAVLPTETGYMLAALATSLAAVERAFAVKFRDHAQVMHVACASLTMAAEIGELTPQALRLLGEFTPGPVSVV